MSLVSQETPNYELVKYLTTCWWNVRGSPKTVWTAFTCKDYTYSRLGCNLRNLLFSWISWAWLGNSYLILWNFFVSAVSLKDTVGRPLPSWGGSWVKPCQWLIGYSLLMMIHSSGNWEQISRFCFKVPPPDFFILILIYAIKFKECFHHGMFS